MCRSIKQLRPPVGQPSDRLYPTPRPTDEDVRAAALQFVRKVSGYRKPSRGNQVAFDRAVEEITAVTEELLKALVIPVAHK